MIPCFAQLFFTVCILLSFNNLMAAIYSPSQDHTWSITASAGNGSYQIPADDKNTALGRLALENELLLAGDIALGFEFGLQTGSKMRLNLYQKTLTMLRWLPVQTTLSPTLDLLITTKTDPLWESALFAQLKGGIAYRRWHMDQTLNDISQLAGELQAGFGYPITALANLNVLYQGIYGNRPNFQMNSFTQKEQLTNIPTLHAVLLGLSVNL